MAKIFAWAKRLGRRVKENFKPEVDEPTPPGYLKGAWEHPWSMAQRRAKRQKEKKQGRK